MAELALIFGSIGEAIGVAGPIEAGAEAAAVGGEAAAAGAGEAAAAGGSGLSWLGAAGTGAQVLGTLKAGQTAKEQAAFLAQQQERQAAERRAQGTRAAAEQQRKTALVLSSQRALSADSGAGTLNPSILSIMGDTAALGKYQEGMAFFNGQNQAAGLTDAAAASRYKGAADYTGSLFTAAGQGLTGAYKISRGGYG